MSIASDLDFLEDENDAELALTEQELGTLSQSPSIAHAIAHRMDRALYHGVVADIWKDPQLGITNSGIYLEPEQIVAMRGMHLTLLAGRNLMYLEAPTGWGKTVASFKLLELLKDEHKQPPRTVILVDDTDKMRQWRKEFDDHKPDLGAPGRPVEDYVGIYYGHEKQDKPVLVMPYASFVKGRKEGRFGPDAFDIVILDEGHMSLSEIRREILSTTNAVQIALSATPAYSRQKSLARYFACAYECSPQKAVELGIIAPYENIVIMQPEVDLGEDVIREGGKFDEKELQKRFHRAHLTKSFLDFYRTWKPKNSDIPIFGRQGIINCLSVDHAEEMAAEINAALGDTFGPGITPALALSGRSKRGDRIQGIKDYHEGRVLMLCGDQLFIHGFDAPIVDFVFNTDPSTSGVKVGQRGGRGRRRDRTGLRPNKIAYIIDVLYNNRTTRGWQLLYREWAEGRLRRDESIDFSDYEKGSKPRRGPSQKLKEIDWDKVEPDKVVDTPEALEDLIRWRQSKWLDIKPAPKWADRFPIVWDNMKWRGFLSIKAMRASLPPPFDNDLRIHTILKGITNYYDPDQHEWNWHPVCLAMARAFGMHVSRLWPVPEGYQGKHDPSPEARARMRLRKKLRPLLEEAGFENLADLARFLGSTPQSLNSLLSAGRGNLRRSGRWSSLARRTAEALLTTPEYLFGLPKKIRGQLDTITAFSEEGTAMPIDMTMGLVDTLTPRYDHMMNTKLKQTLAELMHTKLPPRIQRVIALRQGLNVEERTLEETGVDFYLTRTRVGQLENKGYRILGSKANARKLRPFLDELKLK